MQILYDLLLISALNSYWEILADLAKNLTVFDRKLFLEFFGPAVHFKGENGGDEGVRPIG